MIPPGLRRSQGRPVRVAAAMLLAVTDFALCNKVIEAKRLYCDLGVSKFMLFVRWETRLCILVVPL